MWTPQGFREKITSYRLAYYESEAPIGPRAKHEKLDSKGSPANGMQHPAGADLAS